ncbi:hypothetical protein VTJ83DRAFT_1375 [Remersonia thermophila]|uniref:Heterokaryon incompatibility domain-containing protein n=1 Tax=Remersonia thermophila TaxID=72144 RepID=A0ABR4DNW2_9PEZI
MRLINVHTLELEEFVGMQKPAYAILSHTWGDQELLYTDMDDLERARRTKTAGFMKLEGSCALAKQQGFNYVWIDTCCIDKRSSSELSEAINSMFSWYQLSHVCYAYLSDVHDWDESGREYGRSELLQQLDRSRWFRRGWTLQELIAPRCVELYTANWTCIGKKDDDDLLPLLSRASLVDECVLGGVIPVYAMSVAKRMFWASKRETTRIEDVAYCLLGIFGINMPLLYGEGTRAFVRLQQEIIKATNDQSIFAWYCVTPVPGPHFVDGGVHSYQFPGALADSPKCFALSGDIWPHKSASNGIPLEKQDIECPHDAPRFWAVTCFDAPQADFDLVLLNCQLGPVPGTFPTLLVRRGNRWRDGTPAAVTRYITPGEVTRVSLGTPDDFWDGFPEYFGFEEDLPEEPECAAPRVPSEDARSEGDQHVTPLRIHPEFLQPDPNNSKRAIRYNTLPGPISLQRIVITTTSTLSGTRQPLPARRSSPSARPWIRQSVIDQLMHIPFWILVQAKENSGNVLGVSDAFPRRLWNGGSHRFYWGRLELEGSEQIQPGDPICLGVIRISLGHRNKPNQSPSGIGLLFFGVRLDNSNHQPIWTSAGDFIWTTQPWCFLKEDNGEDLGQAHRNPKLRDGRYVESQRQSISLDGGWKLKAVVQDTTIHGESCFLTHVRFFREEDA